MYDINPAVARLSSDEQKQFTYCLNARVRGAKVEIIEGDARLAMEREIQTGQNRQFDVVALDAFSSDSIPVHLMTCEALAIYGKHLKNDGVLAIHISNRYLDLEPVVQRLARELSYQMILIDSPDGKEVGQDWVYSATWILLSRSEEFIEKVEANGEIRTDLSGLQDLPLWTDDYASIFRILRKPDWLPVWLGGEE
jgi:spermidine synthase